MNFQTEISRPSTAATETATLTRARLQIPDIGGKRFWPDEDGAVQTDTFGFISKAALERVEVADLTEFADLLTSLEAGRDVLIYGVPAAGKVALVSAAEATGASDEVVRSNEAMPHPSGPAIFALDYDPAAGTETLSQREFIAALKDAVVNIASAQALWWTSSSSHIHTAEGEVRGLRGQRLYFIAKEGTDIERATKVLAQYLWLAGYGHIEVSANGTLLERTLIEKSMAISSKPDYAAGAFCCDGVWQERGDLTAPEEWVRREHTVDFIHQFQRLRIHANRHVIQR